MCLGIPGKIVRWLEREGAFAQAEVEFDGIRRKVHMACVTEAETGDYVVVHAGIAISRINPMEAKRIFETLAEWGEDEGWRSDLPEDPEASP
ncbi:MAG: HypC/HybG/HupF family hydrogenase formation chaperone [Planctomycetes bacterium]|nr:HypC/HybG/HupF family hydrogenase formation chaperone [Planctomycetota bacterium]MCH9727288.1 HypC/HybG/HupF family hydrogenase formation chaperone [Planctomycetota bacterium]MCH9779146.1 HypC/HybG/HupF family hydrogenase formation chaperone [Planctomycetota bacterium]MCH9792312.1 HypC/HybG/HupF family hydrogenase formation chaperone [Planctomycetota bacterium]MDF1745880.1 HypC/HybG/HupF family hydrogenase formation chaperone [Gimesia sp.]